MSELLTSLFPIAEQIKNMSQEELEDLGLTLEDVAMLEIITDPAEWAKYYLDWHARDYQRKVLEQGAKQNRLVLRMGRRLGKCLPGWVEVYNPKTGEIHTVKELYEKQQATIASLVNYRMSVSETNTVIDNGVKPVYRVLLESGRYIDATDNHPLYRVDGWVEIKDLKVGDYVAVPNELPLELENELPLTPKEVKEIVIDFARSNNPSELMRLNKKQLKEALYFLFKTYGIQLGSEMHYSGKELVVRRLQHLLLRIGLKSRIEKKDGLYVCITDFHDCLNGFSNQNEKIIEEEFEKLSKEGRESKIERYHPNDKMTVKTKRISKKRHIQNLYYADIHFEKIVSIERLGVHRTYDLSIEGVHNFIANDILVHNTETMCVLILWHAFTQINRDPTKKMSDPYDILILTPYEKQAVLIYDRLIELIEGSKEFKKSIKRKVFLRIELQNNTCIQLMTLGTDSGKGAANIRGQRADLLVYDEVDYIDESSIANSMAIVNEDKRRIKVIAASTPSGDRKSFYRWCNNATHSFDVDSKLLEETGECRYNYTYRKGSQGNGWTHIHASSYVNRKLLEVNPETGMTGIEELRQELTEMKFLQEVMAEFGESETGVYQKKYIDQAVEDGQHLGIRYVTDYYGHNLQDFKRIGPRILGIDWDCRGNPTNMVGVQYIEQYGVFAPFLRVEIPQTEFTYDNAVKKVIELHKVFNFDWIFCDAGAGEAQIQFLKKYGLEHPETGLHYKVVRVNFSEKIEVRDPFTYERIKQHIKPFMVNNTVRLLERGQLVFNPEDHIMIKQFVDYHVVQWGKDGRPVYTDENEHIHDCVILAIHGFILKYTDMLSVRRTVSVKQLGKVEYGQEKDNYLTKSRSSVLEEKEARKDNVMFGKIKSPRRKSYMAMPTRRMF